MYVSAFCLEKAVSEMTYLHTVSSGMLNPTHSLISQFNENTVFMLYVLMLYKCFYVVLSAY